MDNTGDRQYGFSLIELVIVMAIVGILATIAIPSYNAYIVRSYRADAQEFMLQASTSAQAYRLSNRIYPSALGDGAGEISVMPSDKLASQYDLTLSSDNTVSPPTYQLTATPVTGSIVDGDGEMKLFSDGRMTPPELWR